MRVKKIETIDVRLTADDIEHLLNTTPSMPLALHDLLMAKGMELKRANAELVALRQEIVQAINLAHLPSWSTVVAWESFMGGGRSGVVIPQAINLPNEEDPYALPPGATYYRGGRLSPEQLKREGCEESGWSSIYSTTNPDALRYLLSFIKSPDGQARIRWWQRHPEGGTHRD